jgi:RNA polymerase sigma factor (sigma-70 family)
LSDADSGGTTDRDLVARCREGDGDAWNELVERFSRYVYAIATQAFRLAEHDAEDVFQEVFTRVYERLPSLRSDDAFRPWIGQMTRNCCLDRIRSEERMILVDEVEDTEVSDQIAELDQAFAVRQGLAALSDECREVLDRFFCRDESYRTIGAELGIPSGTIASRISRCLDRLRSHLIASDSELEGRNPALSPSSE